MTAEAQKYVEDLKVPFTVTFIPQSMSRNASKKNPSLNWLVSFGSIQTDYMQGIGHMPGYDSSNRSVDYHNRLLLACEKGLKTSPGYPHTLRGKLPAPELIDVLYCLVSDSDAINYDCFEDWADCTGYETDSRKAEEIYNSCMKIALKLRKLINLEEAQEAFQDY